MARSSMRPGADPVEHAWMLMHQFVETQDRRGQLAESLGFRLGGGRAKALFQLRNGPMTLSELAETQGFDAPYATLIVDKLESHGLVERQPHPDDRRRKLVALTAAGRVAIETTDAILRCPPAAMEVLTGKDLEQLTTLLTRLLAAHATRTGDGASTSRTSDGSGKD